MSSLREYIINNIYTNGQRAITAAILQDVLLKMEEYISGSVKKITCESVSEGSKITVYYSNGNTESFIIPIPTISKEKIIEILGYAPAKQTEVDSIKTDVSTLKEKSHIHNNKTIIDGISQDDINRWNQGGEQTHTHGNKDVLDGISVEKVSAWNAAEANAKNYTDTQVSKEESSRKSADNALDSRIDILEAISGQTHSHGNKVLLDSYDQTNADIKNTIINTHQHSNKEVIDTISQDDIDRWNQGGGQSHTHDNKTVLDGISAEKVSTWDAAETNAKTYADNKISALDASVSAESHDVKVTVAEADGKLSGITVEAPDFANLYDAKGAAENYFNNNFQQAFGAQFLWDSTNKTLKIILPKND